MTPSSISPSLRQLVIERAQGKCEYCLIHKDYSIYSHEVDHVIARKHGGKTVAENLVLACLSYNRHKGSDLKTFDPLSHEIIPLFNPRRQIWTDHFTLDETNIIGTTATGRATVFLLKLNASTRLSYRQVLIAQGRYP
jgi:5-methylcytosine-specific restriction endonuclease McrA